MNDFLNTIGMSRMDTIPTIVKLLLAVFCGGILGIERTRKRRAAGVRTYSMVCLGATVVMMIGISIFNLTGIGDPARLGAQVISGIGFIGAGAIIVTGYHEIKGLTTAAGIWAAACLGLAIGAGYYQVAVLSCLLLYSIMHFGAIFQDKLLMNIKRLRIYAAFDKADNITEFMIRAQEQELIVQDCEYLNGPGCDAAISVMLTLKVPNSMDNQEAINILSNSSGVLFATKIQ